MSTQSVLATATTFFEGLISGGHISAEALPDAQTTAQAMRDALTTAEDDAVDIAGSAAAKLLPFLAPYVPKIEADIDAEIAKLQAAKAALPPVSQSSPTA